MSQIRTALERGVLTVTLDRADKKNAITQAMYADLAEAVERAQTDAAVRVVLFLAEGDSFSAGNDIGDFAAIAMGGQRPTEQSWQEVVLQHVGGALHVLGRVQRLVHRHALAPPVAGRRDRPQQQHVARRLRAEGGAERGDERQRDPPQLHRVEVQRVRAHVVHSDASPTPGSRRPRPEMAGRRGRGDA